tara:strand:- start:358 stop:573 length:216 start_codon:yes stop_codon:yes gene_type:complete
MRDKIRKIVIDSVLETKDLTETIDKLFDLCVVNQQSELLFSFIKTYNENVYDAKYEIPDFVVKDFLENYSG